MGTRDNESMGLTRRGFLTGALALGAVGAGSMLAGCSSEGGAGAPASDERAWDQETDVVVVAIILYAILGKLADVCAQLLERLWLRWNPAYHLQEANA